MNIPKGMTAEQVMDAIKGEYDLIQQKKSKLSAKKRRWVVAQYNRYKR